MRYKLYADHEEFDDDRHLIGEYASPEDAEKKVIEIDNDEGHRFSFLEGYDMILKDKETGQWWYYADGWMEID